MHPAAPGGKAPGQDAGWLGKAYDPFHIDGDPNDSTFHVEGLGLPDGISSGTPGLRRELLEQLAEAADFSGRGPESWDGYQQKSSTALVSAEARGGVPDRSRRSQAPRPLRPEHSRSVPLAGATARRGGRRSGDRQLARRRPELLGHARRQLQSAQESPDAAGRPGFSALLDDLDSRGLLDETLVVWVGEFGRTPRITKANSGREHWPHCYSAVLAGAGVKGGFVFGASDRWAAYPASDPVSPDDLGATILHALASIPRRWSRMRSIARCGSTKARLSCPCYLDRGGPKTSRWADGIRPGVDGEWLWTKLPGTQMKRYRDASMKGASAAKTWRSGIAGGTSYCHWPGTTSFIMSRFRTKRRRDDRPTPMCRHKCSRLRSCRRWSRPDSWKFTPAMKAFPITRAL